MDKTVTIAFQNMFAKTDVVVYWFCLSENDVL